MKINLSDPAEFKHLLETLVYDLIDAREHYILYQGLVKNLESHPNIYNFSLHFWHLTVKAHIDTALMRLCRAYDLYKHKPCLNLRNFLETVQANPGIFDESNFRDRLKDNPYADSLVKDRQKPTERLQEDLDFVRASAVVKKLKKWRDEHFVHRSREAALAPTEFRIRNPLTFDEIEALIDKGREIVNHYSRLYDAGTYICWESKDYERIFEAIRRDLESSEAHIQQEIAAIRALESSQPNQRKDESQWPSR